MMARPWVRAFTECRALLGTMDTIPGLAMCVARRSDSQVAPMPAGEVLDRRVLASRNGMVLIIDHSENCSRAGWAH